MPKLNFLLHHSSLMISDLEASIKFYTEIIGLTRIKRPDLGFPGAWFQLGENQQLHIILLPNMDPTSGRPDHGGRDRHVALTVDDFSAVKKSLDEHHIFYSISKSGRTALFVRDLDANAIEIMGIDAFNNGSMLHRV
jgi:glyoxylase I family protein